MDHIALLNGVKHIPIKNSRYPDSVLSPEKVNNEYSSSSSFLLRQFGDNELI